MCKECHSGRCFVHILEAGIHSSEALMIVEHDKTFGKWHSAHTSRQKRYENVVLGLIRAMKMGDKTEISDRLVYFARTFQNARPLSEQVSPGFYDKEVPNPEEVRCQLIRIGFTFIWSSHLGRPTRPGFGDGL